MTFYCEKDEDKTLYDTEYADAWQLNMWLKCGYCIVD